MTDDEKTVVAMVRERVAELIDGRSEISMPDLTEQLVSEYAQDQKRLIVLGREKLHDVIYDIVQRVVARTRDINYVTAGSTLVPRENFAEYAGRKTRRLFDVWLEHVGDKSVRFMDLTAADIDVAIAERAKIVTHHSGVVQLLTMVRAKIENDQRVGDIFSADDLDAMYADITKGR